MTKIILWSFLMLQISFSILANRNSDSLVHIVQKYEKQIQYESDTNYIKALVNVSEVLKLSAPDSSLLFGRKAYDLSKKHGHSKWILESAFALSSVYTNKRDQENLLQIGNEILPIAEKTDRKLLSKVFNMLGTAYFFEYQSDKANLFQAADMYQKALEICESDKDTAMMILTLTNLSAIQSNTYNYKASIESLYRAIDLVGTSGKSRQLATTLFYNASLVYYEQKKYDQALIEVQKALKEAEKDNDLTNIALSLHLTAFIYHELNQPDEALNCINRCIEISLQLGLPHICWRSKELKGLICSQKGMFQEALEIADEVLNNHNETGTEEDIISIKEVIARIYYAQKQYQKSLKICNEILETGTSDLITLQKIHQIMSEMYEAQNQGIEALSHYKQYKAYSDSLYHNNLDEQIISLEAQSKYEKKVLEIKNEQALQEAGYARDKIRFQLIIVFVLVLLCFLLAFLFFILRERKKLRVAFAKLEQANIEIQDQKEEISAQSEELKTTNEHLVKLIKFKQDISGMIVHDLKNPLSIMLGLTTSIPDERRLALLHDSAQRMLNLVLNILDINKYEDSKLEVKYSQSDMNGLIQSVTEDLGTSLNFKKLEINLRLQDDLVFSFDRDMIRRVLDNIINNAIKFSSTNETIHILAMKDDGQVCVTVRNTGPAIPADMQNAIFEPYGRVDRKENNSSLKSTGLGLTFCKMAITAHYGTIGVNSTTGEPTDFWFRLPLRTE